MLRIYTVLFFSFCFISNAIAQKTIVLSDSTQEFVFKNDYLQILEDKTLSLTINDVSNSNYDKKFITNDNNYPYNINIKSAYWIKFKVQNNSTNGKRFLIESYAPHTNNWDLYIPEGESYRVIKSGLNLNLYDRDYINKNLILDLPLETNKTQVFYVRVLSVNHSSFDYRIKPLRYFFYYSVNEYYFLGIYYGIMLIMAIYNLLIFISLREKVYIYYVFYVFCGILTSLSDDGIGYQYVWVNYPHINTLIGGQIAPNLLLISFVFYSYEFLQIEGNHPIYKKLIFGSLFVYLFYFLLKNTLLSSTYFFGVFYIAPFVFIYVIAIRIYLKGYKPALFFIIGFAFILISIVILKLRSNGTIGGNLFTVYSLNYGLVLEVLILSFALADRVKFDKITKEIALRERNLAQYQSIKQLKINEKLKDQVNLELETKVAIRTKELIEKNLELENANSKLAEMTEKANQMSLKLDLDNWNLQMKVQESIKNRLIGQEVSYEEFNKLFPNENACYRYLEELKWNTNYMCRKCKCKTFITDENIFTRKCTNCSYIESVSAHTLFHAIKFPINKAFYIAYLIIYQHDRITLNELSVLIGVRPNTCWRFKQKVLTAMDAHFNLNKKKNVQDLNNLWESILYLDAQKK